ncbi:CYTOCHROME P450 83B1 [Salix koriyanagi]|uniref:CYTOCHROME P450 83B1 n=1 Tax=Salix koriyanagi TaxID=2511006 RepID=A0A9Q0TCA2_9ROSI|nr:CYTOCHROME P450 83B1 [Salix koriyanagi]
MAREIMKTRDLEFCSRPFLAATKKLSYNGFDLAFAPYGDYWREVRKICAVHVFSSIRVQSFRSIREDEVSRMIEKISKSALACKPFDLTTEMVSLTSTAISRAAFGKTYEIGGSDTGRFLELLVEAQALVSSLFLSDYFPCWGWLADKLTGLTYRLEKLFEKFDAFYNGIIDDNLDPNRPKPEREGTILDVLLHIYKDGSFKLQLTLEQIKAILTNIFYFEKFKIPWFRFINSIDLKGNDFELTPFGAGRRICPGIFIALLTVELSLANLLHKFDWEMPSGMKGEDIDMNDVLPGTASRMRNALCLVPKAYAIGHK